MDKKITKAERFSYITKTLVENPFKVFTLQFFSEKLMCAKSTISEDIDVISKTMDLFDDGKILSITGAAGGVYYLPIISETKINKIAEKLSEELKSESRIISGRYLYTNDILYSPSWLDKIAKCMISGLESYDFDYVITIETKGISLASMIARLLNKKLVVIRKDAKLTEGATIQMNYVTGSKGNIKTMALPLKMITKRTKAIFVDDFMKAGGTARGVIDLMKEFEVEISCVSVVLANKLPQKKLINNYFSLLEIDNTESDNVLVSVSNNLRVNK